MVEDFTFPTMPPVPCGAKKLPFPHFTSPPPWFVVPADAGAHDHHRRCFSAAEQAGKANNDRFAVMEEHKMDMLWEDFNEELARAPQPCPLSMEWSSEAWHAGEGDGIPSRHVDVVVASGTGSSVVRRRRLGLMMMLKLLFLARKSSTTSRKTPPN
ncbi:hypothetical protein VPH35_096686 [Triticum aestivum]